MARKIPLYVTHRLDTLTSGLIVYGKKNQFVKYFNQQLQERRISKKYVALVENTKILSSKITHYMSPDPGTPKKVSSEKIEGWAICELEITEQKILSSKLSWIKINLLTGRTHQIRSQLSALGAPLCGDLLYGSKVTFKSNAIALRSYQIEFNWIDEQIKFTLSEDFE